jgi:hypothetical protein
MHHIHVIHFTPISFGKEIVTTLYHVFSGWTDPLLCLIICKYANTLHSEDVAILLLHHKNLTLLVLVLNSLVLFS